MSEQHNQSEEYQSNMDTQPRGFPPATPSGSGYPPAGYPPGASVPPSGAGVPPGVITFPPSGAGVPPGQAFQPGPPFPPNQAYPSPSSTPQYQFYFSEDKMRRYFYPNPRRAIYCIVGGVFCFFISPIFLLLIFLPVLAGLTLMTVGLVWLIFTYVSRPDEQQYQGWLEERQRYLVDQARRKALLGNATVDDDQRFFFKGSVEPGTATAKNYRAVYKKPSRFGIHYSINTYTVMFLIKDTIVVLSSEIDALNQMWATTSVKYYYYEHVSGVLFADKVHEATISQATRASIRAQAFGLLIDSGEVVGSDTVVSMHIENASGAIVHTRDNDELIQRLLSLLKVHKMSRLAALRENEALSERG